MVDERLEPSERSAGRLRRSALARPRLATIFPARLRTRRGLVASLIVLVLLAAGGSAYALARGSSAANFRLVPASYGTVRQTIAATGTLAAVNQANLVFGSSGQIATLDVSEGQKVTAGQVLASLDTTALNSSLDTAEATLATAQARLATDEAGPSAQQLASAQNAVAGAQNSLTSAESNLATTQQTGAQSLAQANQSVQDAEVTLSDDSSTLQEAEAQLQADEQKEANDCQGSGAAASSSGGGSGGGSSGSGSSSSQCSADQSKVSQDQQQVNTDQQTVNKDQSAVQSAQAALSSTEIKNAQSLQQAQAQVTSAQTQLGGAQASLAALQQSITPAQIQSDKASVTADQLGVSSAQDSLDQATLTSPIAGVVAAVNVSAGQYVAGAGSSAKSASGGSSTSAAASSASSADIVVLSPGAFDVTTSVSDTQIGELKLGDEAIITPDGSTTPVYGTISEIGMLASTSSGVATYPVTVAVTGTPGGLFAGASASVDLVIMQATNVLTVPTSAVHVIGPRAFVYELQNGKEAAHTVTIGAQGSGLTQITSGLSAGDQVVLANLAAPIPGSSVPGAARPFGGLGGGGLGGGGFVLRGGRARGGARGG